MGVSPTTSVVIIYLSYYHDVLGSGNSNSFIHPENSAR